MLSWIWSFIQVYCKMYFKNRKPPSLQNPCVFLVGKGCTRCCIWRTTGGNESVSWCWMTIHAGAFLSCAAGNGHPGTNVIHTLLHSRFVQGTTPGNVGTSICRRSSLCHISSFIFPFSQKDVSKSWISMQEHCGPWPAVPADLLLSACHLQCFSWSASSMWYCFEIPQKREIHIWHDFCLHHLLPFFCPVWHSHSEGQEKLWLVPSGCPLTTCFVVLLGLSHSLLPWRIHFTTADCTRSV